MPLFFRKKKSNPENIHTDSAAKQTSADSPSAEVTVHTEEIEQTEKVILDEGLKKSSHSLLGGLGTLFSSGINFTDEIYDDLEDTLIGCDIGVEASMDLIDSLRSRVKKDKLKTQEDVISCLQEETASILEDSQKPWNFNLRPYVILMVGVNGVGKTTTTAKIAHHFQRMGKKVILAAGDTFRAAAIEQLEEWGERLDIQVVSQEHGADAAAVAHDAFSAALARNADVLIIDTAGRLHTQSDLMEQLEKVIRVLKKVDEDTPHEVMQVLDATTGQNALSQLKHFQDAVGVNSVCLTKLDGSAKGGMALGISKSFSIPIRFIGVGEAFEDLQAFDASAFAQALIPQNSHNEPN